MSKADLPTHVAELARRVLGPPREVHDVRTGRGNARTVRWAGRDALGYVKTYRSPRPFLQERNAYELWAPQLRGVPALLGAVARPVPALVITALPGRPVARAELAPAAERALHEAAGAWLRRLHALPYADDDPVALPDAYRMRWSATGEREAEAPAGDGPAAALRTWVGETLRRALDRIGGVRVPCHRDYQPENWLADVRGGWVGVIDFEHARADHPLGDAARLAAYVWPQRPDLEAAFRGGYGALPGEPETLHAFAVAEAWHRWLWAHRQRDGELARSAVRALAAHGAPIEPGDLPYP